MATKSAQPEPEKAEVIEEALDAVDSTMDRVKVLYEQYFLGIQKQPPTYLHTDIERKLRDLAQLQIRNTALRYRFATLQQKFGSYNSYWRRTLRQIENGTYSRNLFKIGRQAVRTGADVPPEILAAMPKRMREQVMRDREAALALARLREKPREDSMELLTLAEEDVDIDVEDLDLDAAVIEESSELRRDVLAGGAYKIDESDADFDLDAFFANVTNDAGPDIELGPPNTGRRRSTAGIPVVGRAPTQQPRPPADAQSGGHPRPGSGSGSPVAGLADELKLPGARARKTGRTGPGRRSTGQIPAERGARPSPAASGAAPANPTPPRAAPPNAAPLGAVVDLDAASADEPITEVTEVANPARRTGKSKPPPKHAATQAMPGVSRLPASPQRYPAPLPSAGSPSAGSPSAGSPSAGSPQAPPPQVTRAIPSIVQAPPQGTRSAAAPPPPPPQATRSIPVQGASSPPQATRATASVQGESSPPQATRAIPSVQRPPAPPQAPSAQSSRASTSSDASSPTVDDTSWASDSAVSFLPSAPSASSKSAGSTAGAPAARPGGAPGPGAPSQGTRALPSLRTATPAQGVRAIPLVPSAATPSEGTRSIPSPPSAAAPSDGTRSIPSVSPAAASQGTRSIPVAGSTAPSQQTRSIPIVPGAAAAQTPAPVESMAGPFPRIPSIPLPPSPGGAKPAAAPPRAASAKERGAVPRIIDPSSERSAPVDTDTDEPTDVMAAAVPERVPAERPSPARAAASAKAETERPPTLRAVEPGRTPPAGLDRRPPVRPAAPAPSAGASGAGANAAVPQRPTPPPRERPIPPSERREPEPPQAPPPGMSNADVNALYAKYVKAKEILGEEAGPGAYGKLLKTINAQAPKIMEQYKAKGVDFSVVVKDNQVIIRAKPKP